MKNVSTGFGLCVAAAAALAHPFVGSLAPSASARIPICGIHMQSGTRSSQPCPTAWAPPEAWFGTVRDLPICTPFLNNDGSVIQVSIGVVDVNRDGVQETFASIGNVPSSDADDSPLVWRVAFDPMRSELGTIGVPVATLSLFREWLSRQPLSSVAYLTPLAWIDIDGDGDLDLALEVASSSPGFGYRRIWLENIGYERPSPPLAADINGDGRVDGADLGLLLVAWGPNP